LHSGENPTNGKFMWQNPVGFSDLQKAKHTKEVAANDKSQMSNVKRQI